MITLYTYYILYNYYILWMAQMICRKRNPD